MCYLLKPYFQHVDHVLDYVIHNLIRSELIWERSWPKWKRASPTHPGMSYDVLHVDSLTGIGTEETLKQILAF